VGEAIIRPHAHSLFSPAGGGGKEMAYIEAYIDKWLIAPLALLTAERPSGERHG